MNKKRFGASILFLLSLGLSCSVFSPDTNLGRDIVTGVDSSVTDLKYGFVKLDSVFLTATGAKSIVVPGGDTSVYVLQSGVHPSQLVAGRIGDDSAVSYAELHVTNTILATLRTGCSQSRVDSVYLLLHYNPNVNDTTLRDYPDSLVHISVFSCQRKFYPRAQNDLATPDIAFSDTLTFSRKKPDTTFYIPLGPDIVSLLKDAANDTATYVPHLAESDTTVGWLTSDSTRPVRPDTAYIMDSVIQVLSDTFTHATITGLHAAMQGDTAIIAYTAGSTPVSDTLPFVRSVISLISSSQDSFSIVNDFVWRERTIRQRLVYDSAQKYIAAVHLYAAAGSGLVRFVGPPAFSIRYLDANCDTAMSTKGTLTSANLAYYFDMTSTEEHAVPSDSLVLSWQADRFVEIPIDLAPLWSFAAGGGNGRNYTVVQNATCFLSAALPVIERAGADSTNRKIVYGLLDHRITDSRAHWSYSRDSLTAILASGRLPNDSIVLDTALSKVSSTISLPVTIFAQSLYQETPRPATAYLYVFARATNDFARAVIRKSATVKFSALFSNPQK
ncbi:MAG TPA: hypothetical protein VKF42_12210 [Chitinivibrionales bacterium]|jgi:hypothetical protein|nr:hypothetical protein [Chitinivibrionales bacterium]